MHAHVLLQNYSILVQETTHATGELHGLSQKQQHAPQPRIPLATSYNYIFIPSQEYNIPPLTDGSAFYHCKPTDYSSSHQGCRLARDGAGPSLPPPRELGGNRRGRRGQQLMLKRKLPLFAERIEQHLRCDTHTQTQIL